MDLIDRQAAIKAIEDLHDCYNGFSDTYDKACIIGALEEVPSAQPINISKTDDLIIRGDAVNAVFERIKQIGFEDNVDVLSIRQAVRDVSSAQPERQVELVGTESNIEILSELRAQFNCFDEAEEPVYRALSDAICALSAQPEVIRCKDCKYGSPNGVYGCRLERYDFNDESVRMYGEDFCSHAERRTDEIN